MSAGTVEARDQAEQRIEHERRRLNKASAILQCAVLAAQEGIDGEVIADAVSAARELIEVAVEGLDIVGLRRAGRDEKGPSLL